MKPTLRAEIEKRFDEHFMELSGFMKQDWYYRDGGIILAKEFKQFLAQELSQVETKERQKVIEEVREIVEGMEKDIPKINKSKEKSMTETEWKYFLLCQNATSSYNKALNDILAKLEKEQ